MYILRLIFCWKNSENPLQFKVVFPLHRRSMLADSVVVIQNIQWIEMIDLKHSICIAFEKIK